MVCKFCQAELEEDVKLCPVCNRDLTEEAEAAAEVSAEPEMMEVTEEPEATEAAEEGMEETPEEASEQESISEPEEKETDNTLFTRVVSIVCSVVLVLGLAFGVWYGITGGIGGGFGKDDVLVKDCYAVDGEAALATADVVIAKVGDKTLTNRQLQVIYWMEVMNFVSQNSYYLSYYGLDPMLPLSEQYITEDGLTWEQYFLDNALSNWHYYQCLVIEAEKYGDPLSETLTSSIEDMFNNLYVNALTYGYASVDALLMDDMGVIANSDAYRAYVELYYGGMEYFASLYSSVDPTREEAEAYYNAHGAEVEEAYGVSKSSGQLVDVRHILVEVKTSGTDENGAAVSTEEDWANCLSDAESILATWQAGAATEESFALMANTFSEDPGSNTNGGLYSYVPEGKMTTNFNDWCFDPSRQSGDVGIVKTDFGYHIIYFVFGDDGWVRRSEQALVEATCTDLLMSYMTENPLLVNYKAIVLSTFSLF